MKETEIRENMDAINNALSNLKRIYNDSETTMLEMQKIVEYMRLLDTIDFIKTVTE